MVLQIKPSLFHGIAVAACLGLTLGLVLHGPWQSKAGGPQILFASAAAAELARPLNDGDIIAASTAADEQPSTELAFVDDGQLPATPLPVVRLTRMGGSPIPEQAQVQQASVQTDGPTDLLLTPIHEYRPPAVTEDEQAADKPAPQGLQTASYSSVSSAY